jgi:hypothetical protein
MTCSRRGRKQDDLEMSVQVPAAMRDSLGLGEALGAAVVSGGELLVAGNGEWRRCRRQSRRSQPELTISGLI